MGERRGHSESRSRRGVLTLLVGSLVALALVFGLFAHRVHELRHRRAVGPGWAFPSRVYAAHVPLVIGAQTPEPWLVTRLRARGYRAVPAPLATPGTFAATASGLEIFLRGFLDAPDPDGSGGPERVRLAFRGPTIAAVERLGGVPGAPEPDLEHAPRLEPVPIALLYDEGRVRRSWVSLHRVPQVVQDAVVASEDRRFRRHFGFDLRASARALRRNVEAGEVREGGSTITQQLARALFLGSERTWTRKLAELPLAVGLEIVLSKDQILEMYLNGVYWGQAGTVGIGGVSEAARWYFGLPVDSLGLPQAALLAGLIPAPNGYDPFDHPDAARARRDEVLDDMVASDLLAPEARDAMRGRPLGVRRGPTPSERFPSYCGAVREAIGRELAATAAQGWGLDVFTNMDLVGQIEAERELNRTLPRLGAGLQGAFVALDPATAEIRALVGGRGVREGDFNRATQALRQTGSAIKPIVYAAALSVGGGSFTPASTVPDEARTFGRGRSAWTPRNADGSEHESVTLALALARSLNIATSNLVDIIGPHTVARVAEEFGLGRLRPVLSIGLGSNETSLLALTGAYAVFASGGTYRRPSPIRVVVDGRGEALLERPAPSHDALPPQTAALMTGLLEDVVRYGVAHPLRGAYGFNRPVAGKTGTSDETRDAWFIGYVPQLVGGVWVGYDRPRPIGRPAAHVAIPVWAAIMGRLVRDLPPDSFATDRTLEYASIDPWTGLVADTLCPSMRVPFLWGTAPSLVCQHGLMDGNELAAWDGWDGGDLDSAWTDSVRFDDTAEPDTSWDDKDAWPPAEVDTSDAWPDTSSSRGRLSSHAIGGIGDPETVTLLRWQQLWTRRNWSLA